MMVNEVKVRDTVGGLTNEQLLDELTDPPSVPTVWDTQVQREVLHRIFVMLETLQPK